MLCIVLIVHKYIDISLIRTCTCISLSVPSFADPPISPRGLDLVIIGSPTPTLRLIWERPLNVDPQVDIVYTVEINSTQPDGMNYGPFENISQTYLPINFPEALHSNRSCQMYRFSVSARNGAGTSLPSTYLETLPISKWWIGNFL